MACAALRLARFNTKPDNTVFFGLASPMAAGLVASSVWAWTDNIASTVTLPLAIPMAALTVGAAVLMVSNFRYYSPKQIDMHRVPFIYMLGVVVLFALIIVNPPLVLLGLAVLYAGSGPVQAILRRRSKA